MRRTSASISGAIVLAASALALTPTASGAIVPQRAMAGISLGMTRAQVERVAGTPLRVAHLHNEFGGLTRLSYTGAVVVDFQGNSTVTAVGTTGKKERTAGGVGVGSIRAQVLRLVPGARCETTGGFTHCYVGSFAPGTRVTDFVLSHGRVTRVTVGFVID
jgi:hypothetical protein